MRLVVSGGGSSVVSAFVTQWFLGSAILLCAWGQAPVGEAKKLPGQPQAGEAKRVKVTVVVILANKYWHVVDPQLKLIAEEIRKSYPTYLGFTLASMDWKSLAVDEKSNFPLVENTLVQVVIHKPADKTNMVCLAITPPWQKEILYRSICGKFLPVVTRFDTKEYCPPPAVILALALASSRQSTSALAATTLVTQCRSCDRLILAIRVQPCNGK